VTSVLIIATRRPAEPSVLLGALDRFRALGATVSVACGFDVAGFPIDPELAEWHGFEGPPPRGDKRFAQAIAKASPPRRAWLQAHRSAWVRQRARRADVLVAMDPHAVYAVWEFAQRNWHADAVYGLVPSLRALESRRRGRTSNALRTIRRAVPATASLTVRGARRWSIQAGKETVRAATGSRVMRVGLLARLWSMAVTAPGIPDRFRSRLGVRIHISLVRAGRPALAVRTSVATANRMRDPQMRADLLHRQALAELWAGRQPLRLRDAIEAELDVADSFVKRKDARRSAAALSKAMMLAAHRVLHFDRLCSPLADDPEGFLAPFRRSQAARAIEVPRGRAVPHAPNPQGRPLRLLIATLINDHFLSEIKQHYESLPGVEVRFLDLNESPGHQWLNRSGLAIMEHALGGPSSFPSEAEDRLRPHMEWADTVFIDWCLSPAAMFTVNDPGTTRIIIRLHSMEVFSLWPHLVDFSRVDDVVFVSDHLRDLSTAVLPQLTGPAAPTLRVISNAMDLRGFQRPKPDAARFNLGMVGISSVAKDVRWALDVLRLVRQQDPRYRLLLIGSDLNPRPSQAARHYHRQLRRDYAELEPSGAVQRLGQTHDVAAALENVGVILSTSVRESFHCGLVEGAASGAVPVVRDWPYFARLPHSARTLFPPDWVVETPEEAAKRILAVTATVDGWREEGLAAARHSIDTWDWTVTQRLFDEMLLGSAERP
jgi:hypothetical protein